MALYAGFDSGTQGLTLVIIEVTDQQRRVVFSESLSFDAEWPEFGTRHGVLANPDPTVAVAPPLMWVAALDRMMGVAARTIDVSAIAALTGSAQQHGSVYLARGAATTMATLDPGRSPADQLAGALSRPVSPIWRDASTTRECREVAEALGGDDAVAALTGSRPFERFSGPQIRKFWRESPEAFAGTEQVHLVSSFLCSVLVGAHAPLDHGDGAGTNMMDLAGGRWSPRAVEATAPGLLSRLPPVAPPDTLVGRLSSFWRARHGWPDAPVVVWSGDNPSSLIGTGLVTPGRLAVSLGTSDTVFGPMPTASHDRSGVGHVFGAPTGQFMGLTCFQNGSLARERIRDAFGLDWNQFSEALASTPPGNRGGILLPWFEPEIAPTVRVPGVRRFGVDPTDAAANVRGVVEGQMLALARHSSWMGVDVRTIHATGGASVNRALLSVMADVFNADVYQFAVSNSAALGAALRAWHAAALAGGAPVSWDEVAAVLAAPVAASRIAPDPARAAVYRSLRERHADCEREALTTA